MLLHIYGQLCMNIAWYCWKFGINMGHDDPNSVSQEHDQKTFKENSSLKIR